FGVDAGEATSLAEGGGTVSGSGSGIRAFRSASDGEEAAATVPVTLACGSEFSGAAVAVPAVSSNASVAARTSSFRAIRIDFPCFGTSARVPIFGKKIYLTVKLMRSALI